jgi:sporulation protein YlmC with PRC-barrel domain
VDVHVELLLGAKVHDVDGNKVGRIEEFRVNRTDKACLIESYLIGASALIERLSAWTLVRPITRTLHARKLYNLYEVPWQDMDLSDPKRPRLRIGKGELRHAK